MAASPPSRIAAFHGRSGEVHALLGENGAGKSTFIQIIAGAVRPDAGVILVNGKPFSAGNPREARAFGISAVFQELSLVPDLTVEENIWFRHEPLSLFRTVKSRALRDATVELFQRYQFPALPLVAKFDGSVSWTSSWWRSRRRSHGILRS